MVETKRSTSVTGDARPASKAERLAFQRFYQDQYKKVVGMVILLDGRPEEAEDAASIAFTDTFRHWNTIKVPNAYVRRAAKHAFYKARASDRRFVNFLKETRQNERMVTEHIEDTTFTVADGYRWVDDMIDKLPPTQQRMMRHSFEGLSNEEIAQLLGTNETNVRSNLRHARERLKQRLDLAAQHTMRLPDRQAPMPRKGGTP